MSTLDPADLDTLVAHLKTEVREVSLDPSELNLPGVLVQVTGLEQDRLGGVTIGTRITCLAPDLSDRSWAVLVDLWNKVTALVDPSGRTEAITMALPDSPAPVPGLAIPYDLSTCQEDTP